MKKKIIIISLVIFVSLVAYLFAAHHYIYKKIADSGLSASNAAGEYLIANVKNSGTNLVCTALGDSLTAGVGVSKYEESYPYQLAQKMSNSKNIDLHVQAYPGARTSDLVKDLLAPAINNQPDVVIVLIGVNDIHGFVSKNQFAKNYQEILIRLKTETKAKIYAVSIPYIGTDSLLLPPFNLYFKHETEEYNKIIKKLAQANGVEYVDLYTSTEDMFKNPSLYSADWFHPSAQGYGLWAQMIYADFNK